MIDAAFGQVSPKTEEPIAGLPPYTGVSTSTVLGRIETGPDLKSSVVATGLGMQVSSSEVQSQLRWVARFTVLTATDNETVQNEFVASAYFGVEIALERSQAAWVSQNVRRAASIGGGRVHSELDPTTPPPERDRRR